MSGIIGSKFNIRGSGLVGSLGTDGQHMLSAGAGKTNVFETVAAATSGLAQLKTAVKTDVFDSTSTSMVDITGLTVDITPSSSSNKILVLLDYRGSIGIDSSVSGYMQLLRETTVILDLGNVGIASASFMTTLCCMFLDNPATTSEITYKIQGRGDGLSWGCNKNQNSGTDRTDSNITVMEIAAGVL